jgi:hypothetical protein
MNDTLPHVHLRNYREKRSFCKDEIHDKEAASFFFFENVVCTDSIQRLIKEKGKTQKKRVQTAEHSA